jgi:hypothetical protein
MTDDTKATTPFRIINGGKESTVESEYPMGYYVILDIDDQEYIDYGFAVFTSHHVAIMSDDGGGPIPVLIVPLTRVKACRLLEEEDEDVTSQP